jgi:hypothetical protein
VNRASDALKNRDIILSELIKLPCIFDSPLYLGGSIIGGDTNVNNVVKVAGVCVRSIWALISGSNGLLCPLHEYECCFDSVYTHLWALAIGSIVGNKVCSKFLKSVLISP